MATKVYSVEEIELQDGTTVTVRPLTIKKLRPFMKEVGKLNELEDESDAVDIIFNAAVIALEADNKDVAADRDSLEDKLDVPTMHRILEVAGGIKLSDENPNLAV